MTVLLNRIILFVRDVERLATFYETTLGLRRIESIAGEWIVLDAAPCELALHQIGEPWRETVPPEHSTSSNVKLVFSVDQDIAVLRDKLTAAGANMGEVTSFSMVEGELCDGRDPEGYVFQLVQKCA